MTAAELLPRIVVDKPWGRSMLPPPFDSASAGTTGESKTGEIWFDPPAALRELLVKYIFTSEKLSMQVHPDDAQTRRDGLGARGKEECWLVIDAEPGASLGIGLRDSIDPDTLRAAALDGTVEAMLVWHPVKPGDFFYIPAGTIHAIGAGLSVLEVQQNSDITYRLYDYGRPRPLHLDQGLAVAKADRYDLGRFHQTLPDRGDLCLVDGPLFRLDACAGSVPPTVSRAFGNRPALIIPLDAPVSLGDATIAQGDCAVLANVGASDLHSTGRFLIAQPRSNTSMEH